MDLVYLACPYSAPTLEEMKRRTRIATKKTAELMAIGYNVFSPLTHSDPIADFLPDELRKSHDFWLVRDFQILDKCDRLFVLKLDGWSESFGVTKEIEHAKKIGLNIVYLEYFDEE